MWVVIDETTGKLIFGLFIGVILAAALVFMFDFLFDLSEWRAKRRGK